MIIKVFDETKNKFVVAGSLKGKVFTKRVKPNHYMILERGYGIQEEVRDILNQNECETIRIITPKSTYELDFEDIKDISSKDYGHGKQIFINPNICIKK